ncbi:hypothetical protein GCM10011519_26920 [Marmoricola endophyticus]|uniref:Neutral metalloproteinase n=1 Tax=Marmoricola endophyticus TaxID=2040280 RepID=A0A917F6M7_9ACTN|nr:protealysin inhibitor emfourin [Marmoricola endophyticus]GGF51542.1 hypothetical protein GCM10011519_26920 [Marmoricola endophyticus]
MSAPLHAYPCTIVPPYLLERMRGHDDPHCASCASQTLALDAELRERTLTRDVAGPTPVTGDWAIHTAGNTTDLPGRLVRSAGEPESGDAAVDEAAAGIAATLAMLREVFDRDSYDGDGAGVLGTVHYGQDYDNAFWNGTQLVFGDGDGKVFGRFTEPVDVLAHELAHALTERTAGLAYQGQPGALNESVSDVVGACVKQRVLGRTAETATWLVGEGIFLPGVQGKALRSMIEPGTAYDDPTLGKDPQVGSMADYVETDEDNGGVHINSGIPNRAFVLAARAIGGDSAEGAGRVWYAALTSGIGPDTDFAGFAQACVAAAGDHADAVRSAWEQVGVTPGTAASPAPAAGRAVRVTRSGGFAGIGASAELDLDGTDPRAAQAQELVARTDLASVRARAPQDSHPDRFAYRIEVPGAAPVTVAEQDLTEDLQQLVRLLLG